MKIFINDIPVLIKKPTAAMNIDDFDLIIDPELSKVPAKKLIDDVLVRNASKEDIDHLLKLMTKKKFKNLDALTFTVKNRAEAVEYLKRKFRVIPAAGGVVGENGRIILIFRRKKWDLPKGKLKKKESKKAGAVREVEEECGIKVTLRNKICTTWHTYLLNGKYILKKTHWYHMGCHDDSQMTPQADEEIEDVQWMDFDQTRQALYNSYRTVRHVIKRYYSVKSEEIAQEGN